MTWKTEDFGEYIEVRPLNDTKEHLAGDECWCKPTVERNEDSRPIVVHNSADNREAVEQGRGDNINQQFRDGAQLVIVKPNYAYVQLGTMRYYFLGKPEHRKVTLFSGEEVTETILPYDGWEKNSPLT